MSKQPTPWRKKGRTVASGDYDGNTIDYDSATQRYAGNGETASSVIKQPTMWGKAIKAVTHFIKNAAAYANELAYNNSNAYNVNLTYDGIVANEPRSTSKKPTAWSKQ